MSTFEENLIGDRVSLPALSHFWFMLIKVTYLPGNLNWLTGSNILILELLCRKSNVLITPNILSQHGLMCNLTLGIEINHLSTIIGFERLRVTGKSKKLMDEDGPVENLGNACILFNSVLFFTETALAYEIMLLFQ